MKKYIIAISIISTFIFTLYSCNKNPLNTGPNGSSPELSAGIETVFDESSSAYGDNFPIISAALGHLHDVGEAAFNTINQGTGPILNNSSCNACHIKAGEGNPPPGGGSLLTSMQFRISSGNSVTTGPISVSGFGGQLQNNAIVGIQPEGTVNITYTNINLTFADNTPYQLQVPTYSVTGTYIPWPAGSMISPRVAPRLVGLGFLEILSTQQILANQGPIPNPGIGDTIQINGQPNYVYDYANNVSGVLGRFGWKCEAPTLKQQLCAAYNEDMGVTNSMFPTESCAGQSQYTAYINSGASVGDPSPELADTFLFANLEYIQTLAVPAFRNANNPQVMRGAQIFNSNDAECATCHTPTFTTPGSVSYLDPIPSYANASALLTNVVIHPYTDMLLHNMGSGLADNRPAYSANGYEFRTPPLWGIGLLPTINPQGQFLHDGRARTLMEAIMWHGGEARKAQQYVCNLSSADRAALIAFLQSL